MHVLELRLFLISQWWSPPFASDYFLGFTPREGLVKPICLRLGILLGCLHLLRSKKREHFAGVSESIRVPMTPLVGFEERVEMNGQNELIDRLLVYAKDGGTHIFKRYFIGSAAVSFRWLANGLGRCLLGRVLTFTKVTWIGRKERKMGKRTTGCGPILSLYWM